jgi:membrane-bound lytic murein transglycosylase B
MKLSIGNAMLSFFTCMLFLSIFLSNKVLAQEVTKKQFTGELNIKFQPGEEKKLERAVSVINEADALLKKAEEEYSVLTPV